MNMLKKIMNLVMNRDFILCCSRLWQKLECSDMQRRMEISINSSVTIIPKYLLNEQHNLYSEQNTIKDNLMILFLYPMDNQDVENYMIYSVIIILLVLELLIQDLMRETFEYFQKKLKKRLLNFSSLPLRNYMNFCEIDLVVGWIKNLLISLERHYLKVTRN